MQPKYGTYFYHTGPFCQSNCTVVGPAHKNDKSYIFCQIIAANGDGRSGLISAKVQPSIPTHDHVFVTWLSANQRNSAIHEYSTIGHVIKRNVDWSNEMTSSNLYTIFG